ncbi:MAG: COX15/CtaA family protein [Nocardioides sp.]
MGVTSRLGHRLRHLDAWLSGWAWASIVANIGIVVTGGVVRLTGSGLGCPTWPRCTEESFTPHGAYDLHSAIEFGNRMLTYVLVAIAVGTFVAAWQSRRSDLRIISAIMALGIPAQAIIGGITVLTDLNPWIVSLHLLCSMAIIGVAMLFLQRVRRPAPAAGAARGPLVALAWSTFVAAWVVLYVGTVVTGAGPHAGDAESPRNGLDPLQWSQIHADAVFLLIGLTIGLIFAALATHQPAATVSAVIGLLVVELGQGLIGFVQYFTDLPVVLVGFHMLGAALVSAAVTWAVIQVREPATDPDMALAVTRSPVDRRPPTPT